MFVHNDKIVQIFDHDEPSREKEAYITVRASDNGQPQLDDACTIKILIEDINDNQPVFDKVVSTFAEINYRQIHHVNKIEHQSLDDAKARSTISFDVQFH